MACSRSTTRLASLLLLLGVAGAADAANVCDKTVGTQCERVDANNVAGVKLFDGAGNSLIPNESARSLAVVNVRQTAATAVGASVWALHNPSGTRTVTVKAALPNGDGALRPGQFASARLVLERRAGAVVVPEEAVVTRGEQRFVFVVRDGVAAAREVTTGERLPGKVEIPTGLRIGETIVRIGQDQLNVEKPTPVLTPAPAGGA